MSKVTAEKMAQQAGWGQCLFLVVGESNEENQKAHSPSRLQPKEGTKKKNDQSDKNYIRFMNDPFVISHLFIVVLQRATLMTSCELHRLLNYESSLEWKHMIEVLMAIQQR